MVAITNASKVVGAIIISFIIAAVIDGLFPNAVDVSALIHGLGIGIALFVWCGLHAEDEKIKLPTNSKIFCGLLGMFGVAIYLFRAFGFKRGGLKLLIGILATIISGALYLGAFDMAARITRMN